MFGRKNKEEIEKKAQEAAEKRGEAKAYTALGVLGGAGYVAAETAPLWLEAAIIAGDTGSLLVDAPRTTKSTWGKIGIVAGVVAIGALIYAGVKHRHAHKLEEEKQKLIAGEKSDFTSRVLSSPSATDEISR